MWRKYNKMRKKILKMADIGQYVIGVNLVEASTMHCFPQHYCYLIIKYILLNFLVFFFKYKGSNAISL